MFEQIRANKRKSVVLMTLLGMLLLALGFVIGEALVPAGGSLHEQVAAGQNPFTLQLSGAGFIGMGVAFIIWLFMAMISYFQGGAILMRASGARPIRKQDHPQLYNIVEEMCIAAGMKTMPAIYIIDDLSPNAFAAGRDPDHALVAVTTGLLGKLNRDQVQGVIAHEISHIINRDVLFMTLIGVTVGAVVMISEVFLRGMFYSGMRGGGRSRSSSRGGGGGQAQILFAILALVLAIIAPILAQVIYFAASRRREYLADANAAVLTRYPEGLATALEAIAADPRPLAAANKVTAPMYISNPLEKGMAATSVFSTHPPIAERVRVLRGMAGNASFAGYEEAWRHVNGSGAGLLPPSALAGNEARPVREAHPETAQPQDSRQRLRQAGDVLRAMSGFLVLSCPCGVRVKIPPDFKHDAVKCPRCKRVHPVSEARPFTNA